MYPDKLVRWLCANGTEEYLSFVRSHKEATLKHLVGLAIDEQSELGSFYLHYGAFCVSGWYELNEIESIKEWTEYAHEELEVPFEYLALTSNEGQGMALFNRNSGEVFDVEYGKFEDLKKGTLTPIASSFVGFLHWCMEKNIEKTQ